MTEIEPFSNGEFSLTFTPDATDGYRVDAIAVAQQLGFREPHDLLRAIPQAEKGSELARTPNGGHAKRSYLTEAGFYRALGQRQAARIVDPAARDYVERFQAWVYGEVLPQIRRTGAYVPAPAAPAIPQTLSEALRLAADEHDARLLAEQRAAIATQEREIVVAALESATPAIAYHEKYVNPEKVALIKVWAAGFGLTEPQARSLLLSKNIIYRVVVGRRFSTSRNCWEEEHEWRARAGRVTFEWFDLRPQDRAPLRHNGQVRSTLYVRMAYALDLAKKVGLEVPTPSTTLALEA
jgi:prophage antirepressor-like protein